MEELFDRVFHLKENHTDARTEIIAGITTFMTMAYILIVNPSILSATGMDKGALVTTTALASALGTLFMAVFANYPFALAPGMGLNAYFAYTVVLQMGYTWQVALAAVFVEGLVFILLSLTNIREAIFNAIPLTLKRAISVGIGLFIAFIGLLNAKIVVANPATKVSLYSFTKAVADGDVPQRGHHCRHRPHRDSFYRLSHHQEHPRQHSFWHPGHLDPRDDCRSIGPLHSRSEIGDLQCLSQPFRRFGRFHSLKSPAGLGQNGFLLGLFPRLLCRDLRLPLC